MAPRRALSELMSRALGGPLDLSFYASYLSDKLSEVYGE